MAEQTSIQASIKEIKENGRFHLYIRPDKNAEPGDKGILRIVCNPRTKMAEPITKEIEWVIVAPSIKEPKKQIQIPNISVRWADPDGADADEVDASKLVEAWDRLKRPSCFDGVSQEKLEQQISFNTERLNTADDKIRVIVMVSKRFPKYQQEFNRYKSKNKKENFRKIVEKELKIFAAIEAMNSDYPDKEKDEIIDGCTTNIDRVKYRAYHNMFLNICYRAGQFMKEKYK